MFSQSLVICLHHHWEWGACLGTGISRKFLALPEYILEVYVQQRNSSVLEKLTALLSTQHCRNGSVHVPSLKPCPSAASKLSQGISYVLGKQLNIMKSSPACFLALDILCSIGYTAKMKP